MRENTAGAYGRLVLGVVVAVVLIFILLIFVLFQVFEWFLGLF